MCTCIRDLQERIRTKYDGKFKKPIESVRVDVETDFKTGKTFTYSEAKIVLVGQKKKEELLIAHSFCPFCGKSLKEEA
ncbi:MAG: hypothetical protein AUJ49_04870 [Desulfovibrionaceae bacterium CG1_02_65_16]|nr:MAG: hypothetical protein AUJ49_04870 [Desulfovibrionaceae bacterium CG1_02_65_16]